MVLLMACAGDPVLPVDGPFRLTSNAAWAGSTVEIISTTFAGWDDTGVLRLGATDISLVRIDDSTMAATLPDTLVGTFSPAVVRGNTLHQVPALTVHGYRDVTELPLSFNRAGIIWPTGPNPGVIGFAGGATQTFVMVDLQTGTWRTNDYLVPVSPGSLGPRGPGPTTTEGVFAFYTLGGKVESWNLAGTPAHVRTHEAFPPYVTNFTTSAHLRGDRWLQLTKHQLASYSFNPSAGSLLALTSEAWYLQMSPAHDRLLAVGSVRTDLPTSVIDVATGTIAYDIALEGMRRVRAAAFTPDGAVLAVAGAATVDAPVTGGLRVLDAVSGEVRWNTAVDLPLHAVAFDPGRPLLYAVGVAEGRPVVLVFDRETGTLQGRMATPASAPPCGGIIDPGAAAVSGNRQIHFLCEPIAGGASRIYHFTLP